MPAVGRSGLEEVGCDAFRRILEVSFLAVGLLRLPGPAHCRARKPV